MFADSPLLGLGPGTWAARRIAYTEPGELDFVTPHAHDVYLQTAAELGIVGLAVGVIVARVRRVAGRRCDPRGPARTETLGVGGHRRARLPGTA